MSNQIVDKRRINRSRAGLEWLLTPVDPDVFLRDYWEKQPLVLTRNDKNYHDSLLTLQDVDEILAVSSLRSPELRLAKNGTSIPLGALRTNDLITQPVMHDALFEQYRGGATVILQFLHERWQPLADLCANIARELSAALQANIYVTPKNAQGFGAHYDDHDVFVLQVAGQKHWQINNQPSAYLPSKYEPHKNTKTNKEDSRQEFILHQGDCVYIPRGWTHEAASTDTASIHITLGINSLTWADVIRRAVELTCNEDILRESLPPGFANDEVKLADAVKRLEEHMDKLKASLDPVKLVNEAAIIAGRGAEMVSAGRLMDLDLISSISDNTAIRRRLNIEHRVESDDDQANLYFHGKLVTFPPHVAPDLEFISTVTEFTPAELPGSLDQSGRMVLVQQLIEEGFLQVAEPAGPAH